MYLVSLHGHGTSDWPGWSGAPTECIAGTNGRSVPSAHTTRSGVVSSAISSTQASSFAWVVGALSRPGVATEVTASPSIGSAGRAARARRLLSDPDNDAGRSRIRSGQVTGAQR